jgi:hypothetical protein
MRDASQANPTTRTTSLRMHASCVGGSCTHVIWVLKTRAPRHADAPKSWPRHLAGLSVLSIYHCLTISQVDRNVSYHTDMNMDKIVTALRTLFQVVTGVRPRFRVHGGSDAENLALQNIQARLRMVIAYFFAQLLPWVRGRTGGLLVLGSANVDERCVGARSPRRCSLFLMR